MVVMTTMTTTVNLGSPRQVPQTLAQPSALSSIPLRLVDPRLLRDLQLLHLLEQDRELVLG